MEEEDSLSISVVRLSTRPLTHVISVQHNVGITPIFSVKVGRGGFQRSLLVLLAYMPDCGGSGYLDPLFVYADLRLKQPSPSHLQ